MRFTSLLFALPLIGSVFSAPAPINEVNEIALAKRDVDVVQTVQELANTVHGFQPFTSASTEIEVEATLEIIVGALEKCGNTLGIDLSLNIDANVVIGAVFAPHGNIKQEVADILVKVLVDINVIVKSIKPEFKNKPKCKALLARIDIVIGLVLKGLSTIISGLLFLVGTLLISLGVVLNGVLAIVLKLLLGVLGSLLGGLLCGCIL
ncbi:uncharacterized protein L201_006200 [Kwoniella dendrophila CBS 6074]|uniref:Uncharacterized protein n=1 Tax=Kwoniella dendrophila CBS 6074 TaxID=1295534 RepID=A0AAX4K304_9TREE